MRKIIFANKLAPGCKGYFLYPTNKVAKYLRQFKNIFVTLRLFSPTREIKLAKHSFTIRKIKVVEHFFAQDRRVESGGVTMVSCWLNQ